jgi:hypothetical protein
MPMVNPGSIIWAIIKLMKLFIKKKLAQRIIMCKIDALQTELGYTKEQLPPIFGGTYDGATFEDQIKEGLARRQDAIANFQLPEVESIFQDSIK